ncbi:DUF6759 domain-containing protein [Chryseobacterium sp. JJR-5R]|uniref:DUF6759 domain-containing protein n=1 Tax=Chryseobacterium sp. JJR-5R TaxID=3093923 RepID=UPI002A7535FE|nr:DUF6759 domain-containing protein [Chryseobacterium sp. JJR-5R]WPO81295.1 DUF6759 domain-containing protein [Chryseobacterium sp. JJR-5R]
MKKTQIKKVFQVIFFLGFFILNAQKNTKNILKSNDITEITNFLQTCHADDPRRQILKRKLIDLKNQAWTKPGSGPAMEMRPLVSTTIPSVNYQTLEKEEFEKLISETSSEHNEKTVKLLNNLFTDNSENDTAVLLVRNKTKCNFIIRLKNDSYYKMPVKENSENFITLKKGKYLVETKICEKLYVSEKDIFKNTLLELKD